jgi:hypothetical protein
MKEEFQRVYSAFDRSLISPSQFLSALGSLDDFSDDLLAVMQEELDKQNWGRLTILIWAIASVPDRKFTPLLCTLLDEHRHDEYLEAIADAMFDIRDERSVRSLTAALDHSVRGDDDRHFNRKLIAALARIGTDDAIEDSEPPHGVRTSS